MINICFHGVGTPGRDLEPGEDRYWVGADQFLRILDEVTAWPGVALSVDDGNRSDVTQVLPALAQRGLTATFFPLAGRLGAPGSLDEDDVAALAAAGMTVGSHGMSHLPWRHLDDRLAEQEFVVARDRLAAAAGTAVTQAACPLGRYDRHVLGRLQRLGYTAVHTSDRRRARPGAWLQPRYSVRHEDGPDSLRRDVLAGPTVTRRVRDGLVGTVKRLQ